MQLELTYGTTHGSFYPGSLIVAVNGVSQMISSGEISVGLPFPPGPYMCYAPVSVPPGNVNLLVKAFPPGDSTASGIPLAVGSTTTMANIYDVPITMNGVPASISLMLSPTTVSSGQAATVNGAVTVLDNTGSTPLLPSKFSDPNGNPIVVTIADSDMSGATAASPTSISGVSPPPVSTTSPAPANVSIIYNGASIENPVFTATIGTLPPATATLTVVPSSAP